LTQASTPPRSFVFGGSTIGEPWWVLGEITQRLLAPLGYDVTVTDQSAGIRSPRWVADGSCLVAACVPHSLKWAVESRGPYQGEQFPEFRAVAAITRYHWYAIAATYESRITDLAQIPERRLPVRIATGRLNSTGGYVPGRILAHYGITPETLGSWGGRMRYFGQRHSYPIRERDLDVIVSGTYHSYTAHNRLWYDATVLLNLRFLDFPDDLRDALCAESALEKGLMPRDLLRGVDRDVPTVLQKSNLIYGLASLPDALAYDLARVYDEGSEEFYETRVNFSYDTSLVWQTNPLALHPGAERYYREKGYLP
jgi:TRAP-type uncharacterized transport system substrate-binding protein